MGAATALPGDARFGREIPGVKGLRTKAVKAH
jgi:hypothetical protein